MGESRMNGKVVEQDFEVQWFKPKQGRIVIFNITVILFEKDFKKTQKAEEE